MLGGMPYDTSFLSGDPLAPPRARDGADVLLDYTHFTLSMHTGRRLARWVAWNIDGTRLFPEIPREDDFHPDDRIPLEQQTTEEVYAGNDLDRGHIARRADLLWGDYEEAKRANRDSFCFTNIAPQMNTFNQAGRGGVWGELENGVLDLDGLADRRVTVFGGPVLAADDPPYRGLVLLPREYWKVVAYVVDGVVRHRAFLLTQSLDGLTVGFLAEFETYQLPLGELSSRTGLDFPGLAGSAEERRGAVRPIPVRSLADVHW